MYAGDQGPLTPKRSNAVNGLAPSSSTPITEEYKFLTPLDPSRLAPKAQAFLARGGVVKTSTLPANAPMILIGEPRVVARSGTRMAVWKVLNSAVPGWQRIPSGVGGDAGVFGDTTIGEGLYCGGATGGQVFVQSEQSGQTQLDEITAAVLNNAIVFNTHSPGWSGSVYHEILHTFEGTKMVNSFFLKEGIVEWFALHFALTEFSVKLDVYPPYKLACENAEKLIRFTSIKTIVKAYFGDDQDAIDELLPIFYDKIAINLVADEKLEASCLADAKTKWGDLSRILNVTPFKLKSNSPEVNWYKKYAAKNGVPRGGPALPT
jgi:hypothetical protein